MRIGTLATIQSVETSDEVKHHYPMTAKGFLAENPHPPEAEVRLRNAGNLCRRTGCNKYVETILDAADKIEN